MELPLELSAEEIATLHNAAPPALAMLLDSLLLRIALQQQTIEQQQQTITALSARVQ